jgi:probable rRNA maturation factor
MILIEPDASFPRAALPKRELSRFLADACERIGLQGEVNVLLSTDAHIQELNRTYRRKNKPTDVLSFPAGPPPFAEAEVTAGDLAISIDTARRQAEALGHTLKLEVQILMLHGLLHLAGFDHEQDTGQMGRRESLLRKHYGLPAGLIQRAGQAETAAVREAILRPRVKAVATPVSRIKAASEPAAGSEPAPGKVAKKTVAASRATPAKKAGGRAGSASKRTVGARSR